MFFILLIIIILLFPMPLKFKLVINNKKFKISIYNKEIDLSVKFNKKSKKKKKKKKKKIALKELLNFEIHEFFRPKIKFSAKISFGLEDSALTAISYGFLNTFPPIVYNTLLKFFKLKNFNFDIEPAFNNKYLYIEITSIFYLNLVKVIYIGFKILKLLLKSNKKN